MLRFGAGTGGMMSRSLRESLLGKPLDPFSGETRKHAALIAFLAWVGLGADGLSSACYGPEEAFLALGVHTPLGLYLAAMTAVTVFVIAVAYNQVIELFPSGGGGYKVASRLLGSRAGSTRCSRCSRLRAAGSNSASRSCSRGSSCT